ncbi:hypothetical protein Tco_0592479 [Tanacetum coccineum]
MFPSLSLCAAWWRGEGGLELKENLGLSCGSLPLVGRRTLYLKNSEKTAEGWDKWAQSRFNAPGGTHDVRDTIQLEDAVSTISQEYLQEFASEYYIPESLHPELPGPEDNIVDFPEGKVGVYTKFFEFAKWTREYSPPSLAGVHPPQKTRGQTGMRLGGGCSVVKPSPYLQSKKTREEFIVLKMDFFNLINAPNPLKVKTGARPHLSHEPQPLPEQDIAQSSKKAAAAEDPDSEKSISFTSMGGPPEDIYQPGWGVTNNCRLDTLEACQDMVDHIVPPGYFLVLRHLPNDDFLGQYNVNLARKVAIGSQLRLMFELRAKTMRSRGSTKPGRDQRIQLGK